jgi:hypothetical protein
VVGDDYLDRLPDAYVAAARLAAEAGFDGVDVKSCHRYLISELLASHTREGRYGGPFEHRARLRAAAPPAVHVGERLGPGRVEPAGEAVEIGLGDAPGRQHGRRVVLDRIGGGLRTDDAHGGGLPTVEVGIESCMRIAG